MSFAVHTDQNLSVAANGTSANIFANWLYQYLVRPSMVRHRAAASAAGLNLTLIIGGIVYVQDQPIISVKVASSPVILPDDLVGNFPGAAGAYLIGTYRNTTAAAITVSDVSEVIPIA